MMVIPTLPLFVGLVFDTLFILRFGIFITHQKLTQFRQNSSFIHWQHQPTYIMLISSVFQETRFVECSRCGGQRLLVLHQHCGHIRYKSFRGIRPRPSFLISKPRSFNITETAGPNENMWSDFKYPPSSFSCFISFWETQLSYLPNTAHRYTAYS